MLYSDRRFDEALRAYEEALATDPQCARAATAHSKLLLELDRYEEAEAFLLRHLGGAADHPDLHLEYGKLLWMKGEADAALRHVSAALDRYPESLELRASYCFWLNYSDTRSAAQIAEAHRELGRVVQRVARPVNRRYAQMFDPERRIRIGYFSPDLRNHSVGYFASPILKHHDRERFEVFCYYTYEEHKADDAMTRALRALPLTWRDQTRTDQPTRAEQIFADRIDILVELSGLTQGHSLSTLCLRPAPVQVSYCGYPNSTGISMIDYRIVDERTDPPGSGDLAVEALYRLPECFLCYSPPPEAPAASPLPSARGEPFTFGSFNLSSKMSPTTCDLWSRVLAAVPGSRLLLKSFLFKWTAVRERCIEQFVQRGIDPQRLDLLAAVDSTAEHLALYSRIDLALDTYPYHGTTTTCEAMWMGVPVLSLVGDRHACRVASSLLHTVGVPDLLTGTPEAFVARAVELAGQPTTLAALRADLRGRMQGSALCDAAGFTARLEAAYREMWRRRCASV